MQEAEEWCNRYRRSQNITDINQAWELYVQVYRHLEKSVKGLKTLELQYVSKRLLMATDLELAMPGTYQSGRPIVRIASFDPVLTILNSKQRPRKLSIRGSDHKDYQFLLKGHEDLRQDERVMQLFGLINTLLATNTESYKRNLSNQRYVVIPLSPTSGLIGWSPIASPSTTSFKNTAKTRLRQRQRTLSDASSLKSLAYQKERRTSLWGTTR